MRESRDASNGRSIWVPKETSTMSGLIRLMGFRVVRAFPSSVIRRIQAFRGKPDHIPFGMVRFGDLERLRPVSRHFGADRGAPIDRYYIEKFLAQNACDIKGHVLEALDDSYTQRFGATKIARSDIVSIEATNRRATIVGDLVQPGILPDNAFDCIILTQVLQYIYDLRAAAAALNRALRPGGVLLVTVPGVSRSQHCHWPWYWSFTAPAVRRLFEDQFGQGAVTVEAHGNVYAAAAFLYGIATEELDISDLDTVDTDFPVIVAARIVKQQEP
jgi:SAM-dependent methyltransferase